MIYKSVDEKLSEWIGVTLMERLIHRHLITALTERRAPSISEISKNKFISDFDSLEHASPDVLSYFDKVWLGVFSGKLKGMLVVSHDARQAARVGNDVPRERHRNVFVANESITIVPEVILCRQTFVIQDCVVSPLNDFVPEDHLIQFVIFGFVLGGQIQEELLDVPIEEMREIRLQVPAQESKIVLWSICREIWNVLNEKSDSLNVNISLMLVESSSEETTKREAGDDAECEGEYSIRPWQEGMHDQFQS